MKTNTSTALKLTLITVVMFGFGYLLVPIYDVFCEVTGINGKTGTISDTQARQSAVDRDRIITVEFDTNVNSALPWNFKSLQRRVTVHPGEIGEALFVAENLSAEAVVGQAVPSVAPSEGSVYFNKTECFCFSRQRLEPGEKKEMPVRFIIDTDIPPDISTLILSYTFFRVQESS